MGGGGGGMGGAFAFPVFGPFPVGALGPFLGALAHWMSSGAGVNAVIPGTDTRLETMFPTME